MLLKALVFTPERKLAAAFARAVAEIPLNWVLLEDQFLPKQLLEMDTYDLLIVDCTTEVGRSLLMQARRCELNHRCVTLAVTADKVDGTLKDLAADDYVDGLVQLDALADKIRATLPLLQRKRRSPRCDLNIEVMLKHSLGQVPATVLMLSEGGMMLRLANAVGRFEILSTKFVLPGTSEEIEVQGKIVWEGPELLVGLRFLGLEQDKKRGVSEWVSRTLATSMLILCN